MADDIGAVTAEVATEEFLPTPSPPMTYRFAAGGFGGAASVIVGHPMDTIKVKLQTQRRVLKGEMPLYSGTLDCASKTFKSDGFKGFYRGVTLPLLGTVPVFATCFFAYGFGQSLFFSKNTAATIAHPSRRLTSRELLEVGAAGGLAGFAMGPVIGPMERVKCMMQVARQEKMSIAPNGEIVKGVKGAAPINMRAMCSALYRQGGLRSVFRGVPATIARDTAATAFYFVAYELVKKELLRLDCNPAIATLVAGGMAGVSNWIIAIPIDTLKSNLQVSADPSNYPQGIRSVWKEMRANREPVSSLFRGLTPALLRAFPSNAACFLGYETAMNFLMKDRQRQ